MTSYLRLERSTGGRDDHPPSAGTTSKLRKHIRRASYPPDFYSGIFTAVAIFYSCVKPGSQFHAQVISSPHTSHQLTLQPTMRPQVTVNHAVAIMALLLGMAVFSVLSKYGVPSKIVWGSAILSILVVSIFWSCVNLGSDDEDEDN